MLFIISYEILQRLMYEMISHLRSSIFFCFSSVLDEQKAGVTKEATDLRASLREVEKARLDARRELQDLRRQVKQLDSERSKLGREVLDLQSRVARDEEKEEESRRMSFDLKQKV